MSPDGLVLGEVAMALVAFGPLLDHLIDVIPVGVGKRGFLKGK